METYGIEYNQAYKLVQQKRLCAHPSMLYKQQLLVSLCTSLFLDFIQAALTQILKSANQFSKILKFISVTV